MRKETLGHRCCSSHATLLLPIDVMSLLLASSAMAACSSGRLVAKLLVFGSNAALRQQVGSNTIQPC
jgi:hypothetical protein